MFEHGSNMETSLATRVAFGEIQQGGFGKEGVRLQDIWFRQV